MFLIKEYILLFKCKAHILLEPFAALYIFLFVSTEFLYGLISFFIIEFSFYYGTNYLGLEDYSFIYTLQASFDKKVLFRSKNLTLLSLSLLGVIINILILFIITKLGMYEVFQMILVACFTISIVLFVIPILSIYLFYTSYAKKKYVIKNLFIMFGMMFITILIPYSMFLNKTFTTIFTVFTCACFITSVYFSIINPIIYTNLLEKRKNKILAILREK